MLSLSGLHAISSMLTLAGLAASGHAFTSAPNNSPSVHQTNRHYVQCAEPASAEVGDVFFHPLGLGLFLGSIPHDFGPVPPSYPSDPVNPKPVNPPPSGGTDPPSGGTDPPSGGTDPPPLNQTPEPATLVPGMIGAGLVGLFGWRRRRGKVIPPPK